MLKSVFLAVIASLETALGVKVGKGYPDWARPAAAPPAGAVELFSLVPSGPARIGQKWTRTAATFRIFIFATNEPELCGLLDLLIAWMQANVQFDVGGTPVQMQMGTQDGMRLDPVAGVQQEQHAFSLPITLSWS